MVVFTVTRPVGTKEKEFEAYTRLLEDVGIDVSNSPRVPEPGSDRRWLHAWKKRIEADRFVAELRQRTGDPSWFVREFELDTAENGPVAPLDIARVPEEGAFTYYLTPASRERVAAAFPGAGLPKNITIEIGNEQDLLRAKGLDWWPELARLLIGRSDEEIDALGGVRFVVGEDVITYERIPSAAANK